MSFQNLIVLGCSFNSSLLDKANAQVPSASLKYDIPISTQMNSEWNICSCRVTANMKSYPWMIVNSSEIGGIEFSMWKWWRQRWMVGRVRCLRGSRGCSCRGWDQGNPLPAGCKTPGSPVRNDLDAAPLHPLHLLFPVFDFIMNPIPTKSADESCRCDADKSSGKQETS